MAVSSLDVALESPETKDPSSLLAVASEVSTGDVVVTGVVVVVTGVVGVATGGVDVVGEVADDDVLGVTDPGETGCDVVVAVTVGEPAPLGEFAEPSQP